jgi:hypothetical protein
MDSINPLPADDIPSIQAEQADQEAAVPKAKALAKKKKKKSIITKKKNRVKKVSYPPVKRTKREYAARYG